MSESSLLRFGGLYSLLTALEITGDLARLQWLQYSCKPLLMLSLLGFLYSNRPVTLRSRSLTWIVIGLFFALAGDVFLMIREMDLFVPGLASFLLMQLCYIVAFRASVREGGRTLPPKTQILYALPFVAFLSTFLFLLYEPLTKDPAKAPLWIPVVAYILCINTMGWTAALRRAAVSPGSFRWVLMGALLFMVSDSLIAIDKFLTSLPLSSLWVMSSYAAAQYGIVMGMWRQVAARPIPTPTAGVTHP